MAKIITASNGKQTIKLSKAEWQNAGVKAGWMKKEALGTWGNAKFTVTQKDIASMADQLLSKSKITKNINGIDYYFQIKPDTNSKFSSGKQIKPVEGQMQILSHFSNSPAILQSTFNPDLDKTLNLKSFVMKVIADSISYAINLQ